MANGLTPGGSPAGRSAVEGELAPWTRLQGSTGSTWVYQPASDWWDVSGFQDATFAIDVRDYSNNVRIYIQTATVAEDDAFTDIVNHRPLAAGKTYFKFASTATTPVLRYVRWKVGNASGAWATQFRIVASFKRRT